MRMWRSHPVLSAFAIGATVGFSVAAILMLLMSIEGPIKIVTNPHLFMLWPTSIVLGADLGGVPAFVTASVGLMTNAIFYGFAFAAPVGLVVAFRRSFGAPEKPPSIGSM